MYKFRFILALALKRTLAEIDLMSGYEFCEWMQFYEIEPFDADYKAAGIISSVIANVNRDASKKREPFIPKDFIPTADKPKNNVINNIYALYHTFTGS